MTASHPNRQPKVVVGVDGSELSKDALRWAARIAASFGAAIEAVTAWQYPTSFGWAFAPLEWSPGQQSEKELTEAVDEVFGSQRPDDLQLTVREGYPPNVLIDESKDAIMLVVGSRGHGGFAGLLLGSVSSHVAEHARCSVLVVHSGQKSPTWSDE